MNGINDQSFRQWNDAMAAKFNPDDYHRHSGIFIRTIERLRVKIIIGLLSLGDDNNILEVGCGAGNVMQSLCKGRFVCGLDLSGLLLGTAQKKEYLLQVYLLQGYAEKIPFRSGSFDRVYCSEVLEHVSEPGEVCQEINRVLSEDGLFVASVPYEKSIDAIKKVMRVFMLDRLLNLFSKYKMSDKMTDEWHLHEFEPDSFVSMLSKDFRVISVRHVPFKWLPLRTVVLCVKDKV